MKTPTLLQKWTHCAEDDLIDFRKHLVKHYSRNGQLVKLFDLVFEWHPEYSRQYDKTLLVEKVYGEPNASKSKSKQLSSLFSKLNTEYLHHLFVKAAAEFPYIQYLILVEALKHRPDIPINTFLKLFRERLDNDEELNQFWPSQLRLLLSHREYYSPSSASEKTPEKITKLIDDHTYYFDTQQLRYYCELWMHKFIRSHKVKKQHSHKAKQLVNTFNFKKNHPEDKCYLLCLKILLSFSKKGFQDLFDSYMINFKKIPSEDQLILMIYIRNLCALKISSSDINFTRYMIQLCKFDIENEISLAFGSISVSSYLNTTNILAVSNNPKILKKFKADYNDKLPKEELHSTLAIGNAILSFYEENYGDVIAFLRTITPQSNSAKLYYNMFYSAALYEENHEEEYIDNQLLIKKKAKALYSLTRQKGFSKNNRLKAKNLYHCIQFLLKNDIVSLQLLINKKDEDVYLRTWLESKLKQKAKQQQKE